MAKPQGTPVWVEFGSDDFARQKQFYTDLFGWEYEDLGPEKGHYHFVRKDGALIGGAMDVTGMKCPGGELLQPYWDVYLAVDDAEATVAKAVEHGGHIVLAPQQDSAGTNATILDPTGAVISLWQAGEIEGYEFTGNPGTPLWFELMTQDYDASTKFYAEVFGFNPVPMTTPMDDDSFRYATNGPEDQASSGICDAKGVVPEEDGSYWRVYLGAEDCDDAVARVKELGGKLLDGPFDSPFGRIATVADPTGASFQLCAPSQSVPE